MKNIKQIGAAAMVIAFLGGLTACSDMTTRQRDTAIGAGVGRLRRHRRADAGDVPAADHDSAAG